MAHPRRRRRRSGNDESSPVVIGDRFGSRVVADFRIDSDLGRMAQMRCDCGVDLSWITLAALRFGARRQCRQCYRTAGIIGERFGNRVVVALRTATHRRGRMAQVRCDCGNDLRWVSLANLRAGRSDRCRRCGARLLRDRMRQGTARAATVCCPKCDHAFNTSGRRGAMVYTERCPECDHVFNIGGPAAARI